MRCGEHGQWSSDLTGVDGRQRVGADGSHSTPHDRPHPESSHFRARGDTCASDVPEHAE